MREVETFIDLGATVGGNFSVFFAVACVVCGSY